MSAANKPLKHDVASVFKHFQVEGEFSGAEPYGSGHINDTYLISTKQHKPDYILQRVNHSIFKNVPMLMDNIVRVTDHVRHKLSQMPGHDAARETLTVIRAEDNKPYYQDAEGNFWRLYIFIDQCQTYDVVNSAAKAFEGGRAFGQFQSLLADLPGKPLFDTIPDFHNITLRLARLEKAVVEDVAKRSHEVASELSFVRELSDSMKTILTLGAAGKIPQRVTHNDTKFNNVLIDNASGKGLCVIDLDTVMPGYVQYDFSDSIRTATNTAAEDEKDLSKVSMNLELFSAYTRGFLSQVKTALNPVEIAQLAPCANLLPYTIGVRFLTDYLEGDHYFKTHFPGHNLQRARAQLQLVKSIQQQLPEMRAVIDQVMQEK
jgi:hypothetical protein